MSSSVSSVYHKFVHAPLHVHVYTLYHYVYMYVYMHMEWEVALSPVVIQIQGTKDACASDFFAQCNVCCIQYM